MNVLLQCVCNIRCPVSLEKTKPVQYSVFSAQELYNKQVNPIKLCHLIMELYFPFAAHYVKWRHI